MLFKILERPPESQELLGLTKHCSIADPMLEGSESGIRKARRVHREAAGT